MSTIMLIINILTSVVSVLPKVVAYIMELLEMKNADYSEAKAGGATDQQIDNMQKVMRESIIGATKEEFSGSPNLIPEPIIRIIYEYLVLKVFGDTAKYGKRLDEAVGKGYVDKKEVATAREQILDIQKRYPQLFGKKS